MRKPEQRLFDTLKNNGANGMRVERVENIVSPGMPDLHLIRRGVVRWVELKVAIRPFRMATTLIKPKQMRRDQVAWHLSYAACGGVSFILARDNRRQLYLFPGEYAHEVETYTLEFCLDKFARPDWATVFEEIFT